MTEQLSEDAAAAKLFGGPPVYSRPTAEPLTDPAADPKVAAAPAETAEQPQAEPDAKPPADTAEPAKPDAPEPPALDEQVVTEYRTIAKKRGLTDEATQAMLDEVAPVIQRRAQEQVAELQTRWEAEARADALLQQGPGFASNLRVAVDTVAKYGDPELRTLLRQGLGNNPALVRFAYRVGKALDVKKAEQKSAQAPTRPAPVTDDEMADRLYSQKGRR